MNKYVVEQLIDIVGKENVSTAVADKITHSYDATQEKHLPDVVVYAGTTEEVSRVVKLANRWEVPVLPLGAGSGFTGGTLPIHGVCESQAQYSPPSI